MTTPEPRPEASRGPVRSRREAGSGWPSSGDAENPRFTPSSERDGGKALRETRPQAGHGDGERAGNRRDRERTGDRELRGRTDHPDSPRRPADRGAARDEAFGIVPRNDAERGPAERGPGELRPGSALRWIGRFPVRLSLLFFFGAAGLGAIATVGTRSGPGGLLGNLILLGAVIAALGIAQRGMYLLIPLPALTYLVLALVTGAIHDGANNTSTTDWGVSLLQWIGNGFLSLLAATVLVLLIWGARMLASRQLVSGSFPMSEQRLASGQRRPASGRPAAKEQSPASGRPGASKQSPASGRPGAREQSPASGRPVLGRPGRASAASDELRGPRRDGPRRSPLDDAEAWYDAPRDRERRTGRDDRDRRRRGRNASNRDYDDWSTGSWPVDGAPPGETSRGKRGSRDGRGPRLR